MIGHYNYWLLTYVLKFCYAALSIFIWIQFASILFKTQSLIFSCQRCGLHPSHTDFFFFLFFFLFLFTSVITDITHAQFVFALSTVCHTRMHEHKYMLTCSCSYQDLHRFLSGLPLTFRLRKSQTSYPSDLEVTQENLGSPTFFRAATVCPLFSRT